ncbi:M24 family metallopeptidase [Streptomyces sp. NBC_00582]|uniref:M24 family metallopeptidase n=1 Tax=Streptomyces sp. NBC_00582 TaxID=2975783 RepID=UPI0010641013|nr:Xaa-Pro peptidase family protein [Streptomyces sp. NBC_00582]WUB63181.1 Xaa-Pro peptidase family protein [Streptomyces sp. NBC_00582]
MSRDECGTDSGAPAPFSRRVHAGRLHRAAGQAAAARLTGLLVTPGHDLTWLCGHWPGAAPDRLTLLVLTPEAEPHLLVPARDLADASAGPAAGAVRLTTWEDGQDPYAAAAGLLLPHGHYGVTDATWSVHLLGLEEALPLTTYRPLSTALPLFRAVKDEDETVRLTAAAAAVDAAYEAALALRFTGRRESEVAADLAGLLRAHGHDRVDRAGVAAGAHGADPRHRPGERRIETGDTVVLDLAGRRDGYAGALVRTVQVGPPPDPVRGLHTIVRTAQEAALAAMLPGVPCAEADRAARAVLADAGHGAHALPGTGHGLGVTPYEPPYLVPGGTRLLAPGMCVQVEAGVLLSGRLGVRLGDTVVCTADGVRRLGGADPALGVVT